MHRHTRAHARACLQAGRPLCTAHPVDVRIRGAAQGLERCTHTHQLCVTVHSLLPQQVSSTAAASQCERGSLPVGLVGQDLQPSAKETSTALLSYCA
jgi:hypothetical protein